MNFKWRKYSCRIKENIGKRERIKNGLGKYIEIKDERKWTYYMWIKPTNKKFIGWKKSKWNHTSNRHENSLRKI